MHAGGRGAANAARSPALTPTLLSTCDVETASPAQQEQPGSRFCTLWTVAVGGLTVLTFFGGILALVVYLWDRD